MLKSFFIENKFINIIDKFFGSIFYIMLVSLSSFLIWALNSINNDLSSNVFLLFYSIYLIFAAFFAKDGKAFYPIFLNCMICFTFTPDTGSLSIQHLILLIILMLSIVLFFLKKYFIYKDLKFTFGYINISIFMILGMVLLSNILNHFMYQNENDLNGLLLLLLSIGICFISLILSISSNTNNKNYTEYYLLKTCFWLQIALILETLFKLLMIFKSNGSLSMASLDIDYGWGNRNTYCTLSSFTILFIFLLFIKNPKKYFYALILFLCGSILTICLPSRSGQLQIIGIYIFVLIYIPFKYKKHYIKIMELYLLILIFGFIMVSIFPQCLYIFERFVTNGFDSNGRDIIYNEVIKHTFSNSLYTLLGGSTTYLYQLGSDLYGLNAGTTFVLAHNTYVTALAIGGIFGLIALIIHQINMIYKTIRYVKGDSKYFLLAYLIIIILLGCIENSEFAFSVSIPLILIFADIPYKKNIYFGFKYKINLNNQEDK